MKFQQTLILSAVAGLIALAPDAARADKVYYKNGKVLEGLVQEEYPTRIKFLYQGRGLIIFRDRIERIEKESGGDNIESLMDQFATAMREGNLNRAQDLVSQATVLNGESGAYTEQIEKMSVELKGKMAEGSASDRRSRAESLVKEAASRFDRIQYQQGLSLLLQALEVDSTYQPAHDQMAAFMRENHPESAVVIEYFCERVDPASVPADHPVVERLPEVYVTLRQELMDAQQPAQIEKLTAQLEKVSAAYEMHPDWAAKATSAERMLIDMRAGGVVAELVESDLERRNYDRAQARLEAWSPSDASPEIAQLYVRTAIGRNDLDESRRLIEATLQKFPDASWADKTSNALNFYVQAVDAAQNNNHADARAILNRLYSLRDDLLPEIYGLVAAQKVGYDLADMQAKEASGDMTGAADLALQVYTYSIEGASEQTALDAFLRLAPQMAYNLAFVWQVDGQIVPVRPETVTIVRQQLTNRFNLQFSEQSPFVLTIRLIQSTQRGTGLQLAQAATQPNVYEVDLFLGADVDFVISMKIDTVVSHPLQPVLYSRMTEINSLPEGIAFGRDAGGGLYTYLQIGQHKDIELFLNSDFGLYLPPEIATVGNNLRLPPKTQ